MPAVAGRGVNVVYPVGLPAHRLAQRSCGQGWRRRGGWLPGVSKAGLALLFGQSPSWPLSSRGHLEPGARLKRASSLATSVMRFTLIWPLLFFQKGTFGGQFHSKLCCLCSSTCWLATKHRAAKRSRHTACQAAFWGDAWATSAPIPHWCAEFPHPRTGQCPHAHRGERLPSAGGGGLTRRIHSLCRKDRSGLQNSWGDGQWWQIPLPEQMSMHQHDLLCI